MLKKILVLMAGLLIVTTSFAQTTYTVPQNKQLGRNTIPARLFGIPLDQGASVPWLEAKSYSNDIHTYACSAASNAPTGLGFIFFAGGSINGDTCYNLDSRTWSATYVSVYRCTGPNGLDFTFSGLDENGQAFTASAHLGLSYIYKTGSGRGGGGAGCYVIVQAGSTVTVN